MSATSSPKSAPARSKRVVHRALARHRSRDRRGDRARARPPARRDRADRVGEHRLARGAWKRKARCSPTNMPRACRASAITAAASSSTSPSGSRSSASPNCSAASSPMCSRIPAPPPTRKCSSRCWRPATPSWGSISPPAAISPTARRSTCRANGSSRCLTACGARTSASTWTRSQSSRASTSRS